MKKPSLWITVCVLLAIFLTSCNLPISFNTTVPAGEQTPNATLTALFDTSHVIPVTITPPVIVTSAPVLPTVDLSTATTSPTETETTAPTATNTPLPTATSVPPTAAPAYRANAQLVAGFLSSAPIQDGTYAEWVEKTTKYSATNFAWGKSNWSKHADLEGIFAVAWDSTNLYIGAKITDDVYTQNQTGNAIYKGDAIEVLIDTNLLGDFYTTTLSNDDYQLGISAGNPGAGISPSAYLWYPSGVAGARSQVGVTYQFESAEIYRIEAVIPWSMLGVTPYNGMRLGFALNVDDNDNVTDYDKQTMLSTAAGLSVFNPTTWGELVLTK